MGGMGRRHSPATVPPWVLSRSMPTRSPMARSGRLPTLRLGVTETMQIVRLSAGLALVEDGAVIAGLTQRSLAELLHLPVTELRGVLEGGLKPSGWRATTILAPIDGQTEVWAAGVTYRRSEEARVEE